MKKEKEQIYPWEAFIDAFKSFYRDYSVLIPAVLFLVIILFGCITLFVVLTSFYASIIGILLFAFIFLPFLYSFQIMVGKLYHGQNVHLVEFYFGFIKYYKNRKIGTYSFLLAFVLTYLILTLCLSLALSSYDFYNPDALTNIINNYMLDPSMDLNSEVFAMPGFVNFLIPFLGIGFIFPICFIFRKSLKVCVELPVKTISGLTSRAYHSFMNLKSSARRYVMNGTRIPRYAYCLTFYIAFTICAYYLNKIGSIKLEVNIVISLGLSLLLSAIFIGPLYLLAYESIEISLPLYYTIIQETLDEMKDQIEKSGNDQVKEMFEDANKDLEKYLDQKVDEQNKNED